MPRGGFRKNAGRKPAPPNPDARTAYVATRVKPEAKARLEEQASRAGRTLYVHAAEILERAARTRGEGPREG